MSLRILAYYLPQYYPIPENDEWWGKGFTEWTNVAKARPLFRGHVQPKIPADLGFYDLRVPETRQAQSDLAIKYGIDGFCYWHYWFGNGKVLLDYPIKKVLETGKPEISFCFAWANQTWGGLPYGDGFERILIEQTYPGIKDYEDHFYYVLPYFRDKRYSRINSKPIFQINHPSDLPDVSYFISFWKELAVSNGLPGIYFIAHELPEYKYMDYGFDGLSLFTPQHLFIRYNRSIKERLKQTLYNKIRKNKLSIYDYRKIVEASNYNDLDQSGNYFPVAIPNWDHSPRSKNKAKIIINNTPELFKQNLINCYNLIRNKPEEERIIFIKAWNEWAEGNFLEPDMQFGHSNLISVRNFKASII